MTCMFSSIMNTMSLDKTDKMTLRDSWHGNFGSVEETVQISIKNQWSLLKKWMNEQRKKKIQIVSSLVY